MSKATIRTLRMGCGEPLGGGSRTAEQKASHGERLPTRRVEVEMPRRLERGRRRQIR
jgi:hypothetical protein